MNNIILTIEIPTYSPEEYLAQAITNIAKEILSGDERFFEIHIFDNAYTDSTSQVIKPFLIQYPNLITRITIYSKNLEFKAVPINFKCRASLIRNKRYNKNHAGFPIRKISNFNSCLA